MSESESQRNTPSNPPKRQIARLIGASDYPIWVLSEIHQLVFVNEAFERLLPNPDEDWLGVCCLPDAQESTPERTLLARWLAIPTDGSRQQVRLVYDQIPDGLKLNQEALACSGAQRLIRWIVPLDQTSEPCALCMLKPDDDEIEALRGSHFHTRIELPALQFLHEAPLLESWWYLHGNSPRTATLRRQLQLAILGDHPLRLEGVPGSPLVAMAELIFRERDLRVRSSSVRTSESKAHHPRIDESKPDVQLGRSGPVVIDCRLMDGPLLQSIFDWLDDIRREKKVPRVILHGIDSLPIALRESLANAYHNQAWDCIATIGSSAAEGLEPAGSAWKNLVEATSVQVISLPPLADRTDEIESLLFAWMRKHSNVQWTPGFLDSLLAYSWPNDAEEFEESLRHAIGAGNREASNGQPTDHRVLDERTLPISLRTFPSHIETDKEAEVLDLDDILLRIERELIERALSKHPRNNTAAAKSIGISRARLLRRMQQWGLGGSPKESASHDEVIFEEIEPEE